MIRESQIPIMRGDGVEKLQVLDFSTSTVSEVIQFIRDSWGINNDRALWVLMSRITRLLDESSVGGEDDERRYAAGSSVKSTVDGKKAPKRAHESGSIPGTSI